MKKILIHQGKIALVEGSLPDAFGEEDTPYRFEIDGMECLALDPGEFTAEYEWVGLRESYHHLGDDGWRLAAKGAELLNFDRDFRFCRKCGSKLCQSGPISKICKDCGEEYFAPMNAAVMVLVTDQRDRALLVSARTFKGRFHGLVAGFVETGESLEECVVREVKEETNLDITDLRYVASQSWPFPSQLMIGFTARLAPDSAPIRFNDGELTEGEFFSREDLPEIASKPSLGRRLIETWINQESK